MADKRDQDAARRLLEALGREAPADERLDALIPEYVDAELAGEDVAARYPQVHAYLLANEEAAALYSALLDAEMADRSSDPADHPQAASDFKPDLSFLGPAAEMPAWQQRIVDFAQRVARLLQPQRPLHFEDFAAFFFDIRAGQPDEITLQAGASNAFAAVEGDVPDELRWLEATYQVARLRGASSDAAELNRIALRAAANAGLPKPLHARFAEIIAAWPAD